MPKDKERERMRISFDLDEVLFVNPKTHKTEHELPIPFRALYKERLRAGAPELIRTLQKMGFEVWVYTSSFRSIYYIQGLFRHYGVKFNGIINGERHLKEVQKDRAEILPQKVPNMYRISLHIDDEAVICSYGREYGFDAYQLDADDDKWTEKVIAKALEAKRKWEKRKDLHQG